MALSSAVRRPLLGVLTIAVAVAIFVVAVGLFRGSFTKTVPLTVVSERAGLVMNIDAKVKLNGAQVGLVESIESLPDGRAALHLAMNPSYMDLIPSDVGVNITSSTVFGAKFVDLIPPPQWPGQSVQPGQVLGASHVTVEINTVFEQLSSVLNRIDPIKLNETLGAMSLALDGRGEQFGETMANLDEFLARIEPSLPAMEREIALGPEVFNAYADAAPDLISAADSSTRISQTLIDEQDNLDVLLVSVIGLADTGSEVVGTNRQAFSTLMDLLVPTTDLTSRYQEALNCALGGAVELAKAPNSPVPGALLSSTLTLGLERYRYPQNLPKVAAKGGPQCTDLPKVPFQKFPPLVITDVNANPAQYGNEGILLNSDWLKQMLYGPIDGPPRNTAQTGQPG